MKRLFAILCFAVLSALPACSDDDTDAVSATLDRFHAAAAAADWQTYFDLMSDDAVFLGTDVTERWDKPTFMGYAKATKGWRYDLMERHINLTPEKHTAWFDETLKNAKYGTSRGTGVLIRTENGWLISQYHLVFPIPNDLADGITQQIQVFEERQKLGQQ